jgi:hypothetical protein
MGSLARRQTMYGGGGEDGCFEMESRVAAKLFT